MSSFLFFFFSVPFQLFPLPVFQFMICSSVSFSLLIIPSSVFCTSALYYSSPVLLYFKLFVKNFSLCSSQILLSSLIIFMITTLNSFSSRLSVSTSFNSSGVLSCSFGTCFSVFSFCLTCCSYFHVFCRLVTFPDFGKVAFYRDVLCVLAEHSP